MTRGLKSYLLNILLRTLSMTWRYRETIPESCSGIIDGSEPGVIVLWHGKMLPVWFRFREKGFSALVSASRDGELLCRYLESTLGYARVIRGSSSRGGSDALAAMVERLEQTSCLITPDGPRGPSQQAKPGAILASRRSGRKLMLVNWTCRSATKLGSWDRMVIPHPFARIDIRYCTVTPSSTTRDAYVSKDDLSQLNGMMEELGSE